MSVFTTVTVERRESVTTIMLNRPERRNAVDRDTAEQLRRAFEDFEADADARVAVLCGQGEHFCAGYDLKSLATDQVNYLPTGPGLMGPTRMQLGKPVIAAVEGYAVAGGLELAVWCDLRVASESAVFGAFCRRWGVPLIDGGTVRLPRLIGHGRALDMILTGRGVAAGEALTFGLANRVVAAGTAQTEAETLAAELTRFPQLCLRTDRASSYMQWSQTLEDALRTEGVEGERPLLQEAVRGATRFAEGLGRGGDFSAI
jgi:enoyl-CoA hydratase